MSDLSVTIPPAAVTTTRDTPRMPGDAAGRAWSAIDAGIMVLVAALALIPRTVNLLGLDPFVDEAAWTDWAFRQFELTAPRTWLIPVLTDGRPPLYAWLIVPFGALVDNGILAGRLASAVADTLTVVCLYALGRELASRTLGALTASLWALSPFSIFFARIAADDALLTLMAVLAIWTSVCLARRPSPTTGILCGLSLALAVLAKTTGVLLAITPPLAILVLGRPRAWRSYVRPLGAAVLAGLVACIPLYFGIAPMLQQIALHTGTAEHASRDLFANNVEVGTGWMQSYVGNRFLLLAGAGLVLALVCRQVGLLVVTVVGGVLLVVVLNVTSPMFSRYLLFPAFAAYLLAAYAIDRAVHLIPRPTWPARTPGSQARLAARVAVVAVGLMVALEERADLAVAIVLDPTQAAIPGSEHMGYVQNWYALYGLGQVVDELRARSRERPLTVVVPPASRESRVLVPYAALRMYLRRAPDIRIVEAPVLWRAQDLRELRQFTRAGPTYLVINGSHTPGSGMPNDVPAYTRQVERRLAQDLPEARELLRIRRPLTPNWLSLYRLDS